MGDDLDVWHDRFTDMELRHVCGHVLPMLVDAILGGHKFLVIVDVKASC